MLVQYREWTNTWTNCLGPIPTQLHLRVEGKGWILASHPAPTVRDCTVTDVLWPSDGLLPQ